MQDGCLFHDHEFRFEGDEFDMIKEKRKKCLEMDADVDMDVVYIDIDDADLEFQESVGLFDWDDNGSCTSIPKGENEAVQSGLEMSCLSSSAFPINNVNTEERHDINQYSNEDVSGLGFYSFETMGNTVVAIPPLGAEENERQHQRQETPGSEGHKIRRRHRDRFRDRHRGRDRVKQRGKFRKHGQRREKHVTRESEQKCSSNSIMSKRHILSPEEKLVSIVGKLRVIRGLEARASNTKLESHREQSPEDKVVAIVHMLRELRQKEVPEGSLTKHSSFSRQSHTSDHICFVERFLNLILTGGSDNGTRKYACTIIDIMCLANPQCALVCKGLSVLCEYANLFRGKRGLAAKKTDCQACSCDITELNFPLSSSSSPILPCNHVFPIEHIGPGRIIAAMRSFRDSLSEITSVSFTTCSKFITKLDRERVVYDNLRMLAAPFRFWSEAGIAGGHSGELSFSGIVEAVYDDQGLLSKLVMTFDPQHLLERCTKIVPETK